MGSMKDLLGDKPYQPAMDDPFESLERKRRGIGKIEERHGDWIATARQVLLHSGLAIVTSDDLHRLLRVPPPHPNAVGAVFNSPHFISTNEYVRSTRKEAHARMIRKWRVKR